VQVYSIQGADCASCGEKIRTALKKVKGVKKTEFDIHKVELTVEMEDGVPDSVVLAAAEKVGLRAIVGAGQGEYVAKEVYPAGADVLELQGRGERGALDAGSAVAGKFTVRRLTRPGAAPPRVDKLRNRVKRADVAVPAQRRGL
jgi:copper chaperone CopZ